MPLPQCALGAQNGPHPQNPISSLWPGTVIKNPRSLSEAWTLAMERPSADGPSRTHDSPASHQTTYVITVANGADFTSCGQVKPFYLLHKGERGRGDKVTP